MSQLGLDDLLQLFLSGISTGSIYVLIAMGFITIYNVSGVINLAQGEFVMLGAMVAVMLIRAGLPLPVAAVAAVLVVMAIGAATQRITLHPARSSPEVTLIMITIGTSIALRGLALAIWGTTSYALPEFSPGAPFQVAGAVLSRQRVWIMGAALVVLLLLYLFFGFTLAGKALRACAINRRAARLIGVNAEGMALLAYAIGGGLSAVAGIVIAPLTLVSYDMGLSLGLKGFVVAIMGGLVSAPAAVIGGLLLGVLESFTAGFLTSGIKEGVAFAVLFIVLVARTLNLNLRRR
jgi:branched-chain amino acid transport system permease protein